MKRKTSVILGVMLFAALLAYAYYMYDRLSEIYKPDSRFQDEKQAENSEDLAETSAAPDFVMIDGQENEVKLSDFFGKPIVLNFWASWCGPCKKEMPYFDEVYADMQDDIIFLMVNMTDGQTETVSKAEKYVADSGYSFSVFFDTERNGATAYGISAIPTTYFIDKDGNVVTGARGSIDKEILLEGIGYIFTE